jgi:hypothetical protein
MLRKFFLIALICFQSLYVFARVETPSENYTSMPLADDRWVPWPWTLARPFPWADIKGLWKAESSTMVTYFAFKVVREKTTGIKQLYVKQFDGDTCQTIASGVGIERNQKVLAQMTSKSGMVYRVQLTAFDEKDSPRPPMKSNVPVQNVMVLSMNTLDEQGLDFVMHMQIGKVSLLVGQRDCINDIKSR